MSISKEQIRTICLRAESFRVASEILGEDLCKDWADSLAPIERQVVDQYFSNISSGRLDRLGCEDIAGLVDDIVLRHITLKTGLSEDENNLLLVKAESMIRMDQDISPSTSIKPALDRFIDELTESEAQLVKYHLRRIKAKPGTEFISDVLWKRVVEKSFYRSLRPDQQRVILEGSESQQLLRISELTELATITYQESEKSKKNLLVHSVANFFGLR